MVKTYQADPSVQEHIDDLLQRKASAQVGLVVGKPGVGARDFLLAVIPTPESQGGPQGPLSPITVTSASSAASARSGKKGAPSAASGAGAITSVTLNTAGISDHAAQVACMLPGGLALLGLFLFSSEAGYQSAVPQLLTVLQALRNLLPSTATGVELLVLHADGGSRKVAVRAGAVPGQALAPAELKWGPCLNNLVQVTCSWPLSEGLPVPSDARGLQQQLQELRDAASGSIKAAVGVMAGTTVPGPDTPLLDLVPTPATSAALSAGLPSVDVALCTPLGQGNGRGPRPVAQTTVGRSAVQGMLAGVAVAHKRQAWRSVVEDLKADLLASLSHRVDLVIEDAESWQEEEEEQAIQASSSGPAPAASPQPAQQHPLLAGPAALAKPFVAVLPHRVLLPLSGGLPMSEYLMPGEGPADACSRLADVLAAAPGVQDPAAMQEQVMDLERPGSAPKRLGPWDPRQGSELPPERVCGKPLQPSAPRPARKCSAALLGGTAAGVVAAVAVLAVMLTGLQN